MMCIIRILFYPDAPQINVGIRNAVRHYDGH